MCLRLWVDFLIMFINKFKPVFKCHAFVFAFVYAHAELMDRSGEALIAEIVKAAIAVAVLYYQKDWFGANALFSGASIAVTLYLIVSLAVTFYFHYIERPSLSTSSPSMS